MSLHGKTAEDRETYSLVTQLRTAVSCMLAQAANSPIRRHRLNAFWFVDTAKTAVAEVLRQNKRRQQCRDFELDVGAVDQVIPSQSALVHGRRGYCCSRRQTLGARLPISSSSSSHDQVISNQTALCLSLMCRPIQSKSNSSGAQSSGWWQQRRFSQSRHVPPLIDGWRPATCAPSERRRD